VHGSRQTSAADPNVDFRAHATFAATTDMDPPIVGTTSGRSRRSGARMIRDSTAPPTTDNRG